MQLQVVRGCFLAYIDSAHNGDGTFLRHMEGALEAKGALNIATEEGSGKRQADVSNTAFILEERACMRERLLHAARSRGLSIGQDSFNTGDVPISQDKDAAELQRSALDDEW